MGLQRWLLVSGVGFGLGVWLMMPCGVSLPDVAGIDSPEMHYYLANQALFSGDTDAAVEHMQATLQAGRASETRCPGVPLTLHIREHDYAFCNPDGVAMPASVAGWVAARAGEAEAAALNGQPDTAVAALRQVLAVDPYDVQHRAQLVSVLQEQGRDDDAQVERGRLQAYKQGRMLSLQELGSHQL